jgi:ribonuclease D
VLSNPLVEEIAELSPVSLEALNGLRWFGEKRLKLYGAELVSLLSSRTG